MAAAGRPARIIIRKLRHAIRTDRHYAIKARLDADFDPYEAELTQLMDE